jgi:hypothetical protein
MGDFDLMFCGLRKDATRGLGATRNSERRIVVSIGLPTRAPIINFTSAQEFRVVAEIMKEPVQLPRGRGSRRVCSPQGASAQHGKYDSVVGLVRIPVIFSVFNRVKKKPPGTAQLCVKFVIEQEGVTFRWKDYAHGGKHGTKFLRRFFLHVLTRVC